MAVAATSVETFVALGANLGDAAAQVVAGLEALPQLPGTELVACSRLYRSAPVQASGPDFVNAVARVRTTLSAPALLLQLQKVEAAAGRTRPYRHAPRTLDLDLLLYGRGAIRSPSLTIPHPRMLERAFVLRPLAEVAPERVSETALARVADQQCDVLAEAVWSRPGSPEAMDWP